MYQGNNTTSVGTLDEDIPKPSVMYVTILVILIGVGLVSNSFLIVALLKKKQRSSVNLVIVNLAFTDIFVDLIVIPSSIINLLRPDESSIPCKVVGIVGLLLMNYSIHIQCLILYCSVRSITSYTTIAGKPYEWVRYVVISAFCLGIDSFAAVYPNLRYGTPTVVPSVGYCFYVFGRQPVLSLALKTAYIIHFSISVLICFIFYGVLIRFVQKNSARPDLARQRHVHIFKLMFRKFLIWGVCYVLIILTRTIGVRQNWPHIMFQAGYVLLWINSVVNPLCHILTTPLWRSCCPRALVAPSTVQNDRNGVDGTHASQR